MSISVSKAVIEVGVNTGQDTGPIYGSHWKTGDMYYGFEPVPFLIKEINAKHGTRPGFELIEKAVDTDESNKTFNVQRIGHMSGVSSLYDINEDMDPHFQSSAFKFAEQIEVECIRMDTFIEEKGIDVVTYMHCDAQGNDINVLRSFGKHIDKLRAGVVEAAKDEFLYTYKENSQENVIAFLEENGFTVTELRDNDATGLEVNIHFERAK